MQVYIESIDIDTGTMVVEYTDPYGIRNIRLALNIKYPIVQEDIIKDIRLHIPTEQFELANSKRVIATNQDTIDFVEEFVGTTIEVEPTTGFQDNIYE